MHLGGISRHQWQMALDIALNIDRRGQGGTQEFDSFLDDVA
jgi:hypothetical protein